MGMSGWRAYQPSAAFKAAISCGPGRHYPRYSGTIVVHSQAPVAQGHTELTTTPPAALTSAGHISLASPTAHPNTRSGAGELTEPGGKK